MALYETIYDFSARLENLRLKIIMHDSDDIAGYISMNGYFAVELGKLRKEIKQVSLRMRFNINELRKRLDSNAALKSPADENAVDMKELVAETLVVECLHRSERLLFDACRCMSAAESMLNEVISIMRANGLAQPVMMAEFSDTVCCALEHARQCELRAVNGALDQLGEIEMCIYRYNRRD